MAQTIRCLCEQRDAETGAPTEDDHRCLGEDPGDRAFAAHYQANNPAARLGVRGALTAGGSQAKNPVLLMTAPENPRLPVPPFDRDTATQKVRLAEDAWNTRNPEKVAGAYTVGSVWRNRAEFVSGREAIIQFLTRKWAKELDYRLIKELWAFRENRIAVRFAYEWHDDSGNWFRSYGNENWEFDENGFMARRLASINDLPIRELVRKYHWPLGRRPDDHPGLSDLGL
jgi:uncharacterized protein